MRRSLTAAILFLVLAATASSALGQAPSLSGVMEANKIVLDEKNREIAVPAEKVYPLDTIEYTLRYRNIGSAPATGVTLIGPVPAGTVYLDRTATDAKGLHPIFSIDGGKTYHEAPVYYVVINENGEEERKKATPDMITHVQWIMGESLDVGHEVTVSYRVQVM